MTLPYLPGWGDSIQQNLPQIGSNIAHIVNPNIDIINKLKENPDMLQKLADMEASNPGTMQRLGMGNLSGLVKGVSESSQQQRTDAVNTAERDVATAPATRTDVGRVGLKLPTADEARIQGANAKVAEGTVKSRTHISENEAAQGDIQNSLLEIHRKMQDMDLRDQEAALRKYPELGNVDLKELARKSFYGEAIDPILAGRIQKNPAMKAQLDMLFQGYADRYKGVTEKEVTGMRTASKGDKAIALAQVNTQYKDQLKQIGELQTQVKNMKPSIAEEALANEKPDPSKPTNILQTQAQDKLTQYQKAKDLLDNATGELNKISAVRDALASDLPEYQRALDKMALGDKGKTPKAEQALDYAKRKGLDAAKKNPMWAGLGDEEQKWVELNYPASTAGQGGTSGGVSHSTTIGGGTRGASGIKHIK
jgi:hypothetical protein